MRQFGLAAILSLYVQWMGLFHGSDTEPAGHFNVWGGSWEIDPWTLQRASEIQYYLKSQMD